EVVVGSSPRGLRDENPRAPPGFPPHNHFLSGPLFPRRIKRLKQKKEGPAVLRVKHVLLFREPLGAASEKFGRLALAQLQAEGVSRIDAVQAEALALGDAEGIDVFLDAVQDLSSRHGRVSFWRNLAPTLPPRDHRMLLIARAAARCGSCGIPGLNLGGALDCAPARVARTRARRQPLEFR